MKNLCLSALLIFFSLMLKAEAPLKRTLTLNSGYVDVFFNDNQALVHAPVSAIHAYSKLFDVVTENFRDHWLKRLINSVVEVPFSYWLTPALSTPFHEFGHARLAKALGLPYTYGRVSYGYHFKGLSNFWSLSAISLITPPWPFRGTGHAYTETTSGSVYINEELYRAKGESQGLTLMLVSAGINNQMFLAKAIATSVYEDNGHPLYLAHYIQNKIHGFTYTTLEGEGGDPSRIIQAYQTRGWRINRNHLKGQSLLSLLSGTTLSLLFGYYNYIVNDDEVVRPLEIYGFRLPELNSYINAAGLSFEIESDYRVSPNLSVGLAYEFIWKGQIVHEATPRVRYNFAELLPSLNELWVKSAMVIGKGFGASINAELSPLAFDTQDFWTRLSYSVDLNLLHGGTLFGERNIVAIDRGNTMALSAFAGLKLRY